MIRDEIINKVKQYFSVKELVCNHTYAKWGERSWQFLDTDYLQCLLIIRRDILQAPMSCNHDGMSQRGLRCNRCDIVRSKGSVYLSAHIFGKAGDFTVKGMTAAEARKKILSMSYLLPCNIRMEDGVTWLHFDVLPQYGVSDKVYLFSA